MCHDPENLLVRSFAQSWLALRRPFPPLDKFLFFINRRPRAPMGTHPQP